MKVLKLFLLLIVDLQNIFVPDLKIDTKYVAI